MYTCAKLLVIEINYYVYVHVVVECTTVVDYAALGTPSYVWTLCVNHYENFVD